jgi:dTDP-4-dehydrorhamnose reductase
MLRLADERGALGVVADQLGSPTWTGHLAPALARLLERGARGTFHLTNSGVTSWYGFACEIVAAAEMSVPVEPLTTAKYPTRARRPRYSVLDNRRWRELGEPPLPAWEEGVRGYLASRGVANGVVEGVVR